MLACQAYPNVTSRQAYPLHHQLHRASKQASKQQTRNHSLTHIFKEPPPTHSTSHSITLTSIHYLHFQTSRHPTTRYKASTKPLSHLRHTFPQCPPPPAPKPRNPTPHACNRHKCVTTTLPPYPSLTSPGEIRQRHVCHELRGACAIGWGSQCQCSCGGGWVRQEERWW